MGMEIDNPQAFLDDAKNAITEYQNICNQLTSQIDVEKQSAAALDDFRKSIQDKIDKTLKQRGEELTETHDKQISQVEASLKKKQTEREKARQEGVKGRIKNETEPRRIEITELKRQLAAIVKKDNAPFYMKWPVFYTLFHPSGIAEFICFLTVFILIFAFLPWGAFFLIPKRRWIYLVGIYLLDIIIFGGVYVAIMNVSGRYADTVRQGRDILNRIKTNRKIIKKLEHSIRNDSDEAVYNLKSFDDDIANLQQQRSDIISQKQSAQNNFDTVTRNIIIDEIETANKPKMDELQQAFTDATNLKTSLESQERELALNLSKNYEQYLGKNHMNAEDIDKIKEILETGGTTSIIDAVTKLDHPEKEE
ncbi:hypothetical protein SAMN05216349_11016 [Oribacterium sp. KHPX15]|uniref:hypothetical protein n=1 Tax=unclassified Oribacterium TaxID=2629782 RepID=UPI0004E0B607|nr:MULTISPECIES: hypothetical protein [unclassified Oribacterium]SEA35052.1 hypothetical protein SAMN05216349_11016 [Oribacterium sp. KHPX15]